MCKVSIIIPMHDCILTINHTLTSILSNSEFILEVICIMDGENYELKNKIKNEFKNKKLRLYTIPENAGVANARNLGLNLAKGKFIAFCDADDIWFPKKLDAQIKYLEDGNDLVGTNAIRFSNDEQLEHKSYDKDLTKLHYIEINDLKIFNPFYFSSLIMKRSLIKKTYFKKESRQEDYQFLIDIFLNNSNPKVAIISKKMIGYRVRDGSRSGTIFNSGINSFIVRSENFGIFKTFLNLPGYIIRVLIKRYYVTH